MKRTIDPASRAIAFIHPKLLVKQEKNMHIQLHRPILAAALSAICALQGAQAETAAPGASNLKEVPNVSDIAEQKIIGHMLETNQARLRGWPGMIFYCPTDEAKSPVLRQICVESNQNLENLATQHGIKFHKARNANDMALLPHLTGRLKLIIDLESAEAEASPSAIAARVSVLAHYAHAVNRLAEINAPDSGSTKHPLNTPQHVDGTLWEATVVKVAANQDQLVKPVVEGIHEKLKAFFADFDKANR
jgi:hypothetical protein